MICGSDRAPGHVARPHADREKDREQTEVDERIEPRPGEPENRQRDKGAERTGRETREPDAAAERDEVRRVR